MSTPTTSEIENQLLRRDIESLRTINYDLYLQVKHLTEDNVILKNGIDACKEEFGDNLVNFLEELDQE